jgi:tripartite-type tricarboxylate transporter receptor subunit TctC
MMIDRSQNQETSPHSGANIVPAEGFKRASASRVPRASPAASPLRRQLLGGVLAAPFAATLARAQSTYPTKPVKLLVGYTPGGATDLVARLVSQKLGELWGHTVVVENRPGAGSNIAAKAVLEAPADGYTLFTGTIANATNMSTYRNAGYDTLRDFVHVTQWMAAPSVLVVTPSLPVNNLAELVAYGRAKPDILSYGSSGLGGSPHLAGEMFCLRARVRAVHIPYKGASGALQDTLSGQVSMGFMTALSALPHMQAGKLKPIAVASAKRLALMPNVPTMAEAGMADFEVSSWNGLFASAKTPADIVAKLHRDCVRVLQMPDVREKLLAQASEPVGSSPDEFRGYVRAEIDKWAKVVKDAGIKPE